MNCKTRQAWVVEYADGAMDPVRLARAEAHLNCCADCKAMAQEMAQTRRLLRGLTPVQTSAEFEARLVARLAVARRPAEIGGWWSRLLAAPTPSLLRPALALGAASLAVGGLLLSHALAPPPPPPATPADDTALITQCVALHQRDVAAQPLTDSATTGVGRGGWMGGTPQEEL